MDILIVNSEGERQQWTADEIECTSEELILTYADQVTTFEYKNLLEWAISSETGAFDQFEADSLTNPESVIE